MKCYLFFKVGGGFVVFDYVEFRYCLDDKWIDYDFKKFFVEFIEFVGGD